VHFKNTKKAAAAFVATAIGLAAGAGFAAWTTDGEGSGRARAATAQDVTVNATNGTADLYPGTTAGDVHFTLTNPNPYPVEFTAMTSGTVTSSDPVDCPATNVTVDDAPSISVTVAANTTSTAQSIADVVNMDADAPDDCQGVSFDVVLTLAGASA
jgi:hypothetical protein